MAIKDLLAIVLPPANPSELGEQGQWNEVQRAMGLSLPSDLRDIGLYYGTGRFGNGEILVYNPFSVHYRAYVEHGLRFLRTTKDNFDSIPFAIYPDSPGLFVWGTDDNGNTMCWLTEGTPDEWPIVVKTRDDEIERWEMCLTTFLVKSFTNEIQPVIWADQPFSAKELVFKVTQN